MSSKDLNYYKSLKYTFIYTPDDDVWFAEVKELEGCMTQANTKAEARILLSDAFDLWIATKLDLNQAIPEPQNS